ncbi:MAG: 2-C-methyl-D-erythritol 4-phosphate cytidylyltransferase [Mycoplasmoidaceae bacterium]|nr:2-C-methyl-D-erythritol 4-phosphate cytidylyltransferase [Mycoplasmoidaceae bacterium]
MANYVIILAAGDGKRLGCKTPKCFIKIKQKPIYKYSLELFDSFKQIKQIILVVPKQYLNDLSTSNLKIKIVAGGNNRNKSFENGLKAISNIKNHDRIIVHDAARINLQPEDILRILNSKQNYGTLCYIGPANNNDLRLGKYNIQTPQFFSYFIYKNTKKFNHKGRDLFTYLNLKPEKNNFIISSNKQDNFKITNKKDLLRTSRII